MKSILILSWLLIIHMISACEDQSKKLKIRNSSSALADDIKAAQEYVNSLPEECSVLDSYVSGDNSVQVKTFCLGGGKSMSALVSFRGGVINKLN